MDEIPDNASPQFRYDDVYVAIMGVTGSGKSTFIKKCCGDIDIAIGHTLKSETSEVAVYTLTQHGRTIHLIDTPGFDDTYRSDTDVLQELAYWLAKSYKNNNIKLTGMIYLHRITDPRMTGNAFKNLRTFQKLCGKPSMSSVILATARWDEVSAEAGEIREADLRNTPAFWGDMVNHGSTIVRHSNDRQSAMSILGILVQKGSTTVLDIQREMVEQNRTLGETEAGREVEGELRRQREVFEKRLKRAQEEMKEALAANDSKYAEQIARDQEKLQAQIRESERGRQELQISMERLIKEKDEQHQQALQQLRDERSAFKKETAAFEKKVADLERVQSHSSSQGRNYNYMPYQYLWSAPAPYTYSYYPSNQGERSRRSGGSRGPRGSGRRVAAIGAGAAVGGTALAALSLAAACCVM